MLSVPERRLATGIATGTLACLLIALAPSRAPAAWPIGPTDAQHPIRGGFGDPRWDGRARNWRLHGGVDVAVDERVKERRRVYSLVAGVVQRVTTTRDHPCGSVTVGRVQLGHVDPVTVRVGERVRAGQPVGWTCPGYWHVHVSEFGRDGKQVNPLRAGGVLFPYEDTAAPAIRAIERGESGFEARIDDPQSFRGWFDEAAQLYDDNPPSVVALDGRVIADFRRIGKGSSAVYERVYSPRTRRNLTVESCLRAEGPPCAGEHWFQLGSLEPGEHVLKAWDIAGNASTKRFTVPEAGRFWTGREAWIVVLAAGALALGSLALLVAMRKLRHSRAR